MIVSARDIELAARAKTPFSVPPGAILTPSARERAKDLGVVLLNGTAPSAPVAPEPPAALPVSAPPPPVSAPASLDDGLIAEQDDLIGPLTSFIVETTNVPAEVIEFARVLLLDTIGVGFAGTTAEGVTGLIAALGSVSGGRGARVLGRGDRLAVPDAALANGALVHSLEFDSAYDAGLIHPMAGVVPAALAAAEDGSPTGQDILTAIAIGTEVICRISAAAGGIPSLYRCGAMAAFGAVAVAARLAGLSPREIRDAFGIASTQVSPYWQPHEEGSAIHGALPGLGARAGLLAVALAREGVSGPWRTLEGNSGYYRSYEKGIWNRAIALDGLGSGWRLLDIGLKPYPSGRLTHGPIALALELRQQHDLRPESIADVTIEAGAVIAARTGRHPAPDAAIVHQRLSVPFTVAQALRFGKVTLAEFGIGAAGPAQDLIRRVSVAAAADIPPADLVPVRMTIRTTDGRTVRATIDDLPGSRARPLTRAERIAKVQQCWAVGDQPRWKRVEPVIQAIDDLGPRTPFSTLLRTLSS